MDLSGLEDGPHLVKRSEDTSGKTNGSETVFKQKWCVRSAAHLSQGHGVMVVIVLVRVVVVVVDASEQSLQTLLQSMRLGCWRNSLFFTGDISKD